MSLFKSDLYYIICNGQVFYSGTENGCKRFASDRIAKFPNHQEMLLLKLVEEDD
jgi:hypothetical protein